MKVVVKLTNLPPTTRNPTFSALTGHFYRFRAGRIQILQFGGNHASLGPKILCRVWPSSKKCGVGTSTATVCLCWRLRDSHTLQEMLWRLRNRIFRSAHSANRFESLNHPRMATKPPSTGSVVSPSAGSLADPRPRLLVLSGVKSSQRDVFTRTPGY